MHNNLANIYEDLNKLDSALFYRRLAYNEVMQDEEADHISVVTAGVASTFMKLNMLDSSLYYSRLCILNSIKAGRFDNIREAWLNIAAVFQKEGKLDSSLYYGSKVFKEYQNVPDTSGMIRAALLLHDAYHDSKQNDSAYKYLSLYTTLKNNFSEEEKIKKVQSLLFDELVRQQKLEQQRKDEQERYETRVKTYSLIAGLAVLLSISIILYRNNKQKQKSKNEIEKAYHELKSTQAQLIQSEKMASLGELTAGIAHEIQNPLNFVNNFSEVNIELTNDMNDEDDIDEIKAIANDVKHNNEKILYHGKRADAIVKGMLQHSRKSEGTKEPTDINALCDEYLRLSYHGLRAKDKNFNADFKTDFDESIGKINVVPQDIGRVLLNLYNNAFYAVNEKKKLMANSYQPIAEVKTHRINDKVEIMVRDNGNGIPQNIVDKIFQPFFTTKPTGEGTGLGLSLSYDIIKAHGGEIKVKTKEGEGSEFVIQLPLT